MKGQGPGKKSEQRFGQTLIERMGLADRVKEMYSNGMPATQIHKKLVDEGYDLKLETLKYFIREKYKKPKKKEVQSQQEIKERLAREENPEIKLLNAAKEAYENFKTCQESGDLKSASDWFGKYSDLMEKQLKASGVYERAKQEASKDQDKYVEVVWEISTVCPNCKKIIEEETLKHDKTNLSDMQAENIKETISTEMTGEVTKDVEESK